MTPVCFVFFQSVSLTGLPVAVTPDWQAAGLWMHAVEWQLLRRW
jgi:hypothetical protein